ncbi:MAG: EAL domain-containing protein [Terracidiphilus sp.]|jgi:diguanylate cyclase (GGDEF)-like protein/PAS domain S-box-containing protein
MGEVPAKAILLIENDAEQAHLICDMLNVTSSNTWEITQVECVIEAEKTLASRSFDVVLLDLGLADIQGLKEVTQVRAAAPRVAIVLLSSPDDEPIAVQAIQEGVQDYLIKCQIESRELRRALLNAIDRKAIEEALFIEKERAQVTLECIGDAVVCTDISGNITFLNRVAEKMTGWPLKDALGQTMAEVCRILDAVTRKPILDPMAKAALCDQPGTLPLNCILIGRNGQEVYIEDSVAPIRDRQEKVTGAVIVFRDVSATRALEDKLTHAAQHDSLTGLPNRALLSDRVGQAISLARRQKGQAAVLFLDLDGFKKINDSLGHSIGDKVLQSIAGRLLDCVRTPDTVSRQGGDEFVVLLQELHHPEDAAITAKRLLKAVADVHSIGDHQVYVTGSIGISVYPGDGKDVEALFKNADIAMYDAKKHGRQGYRFFGSNTNINGMDNQSLEQDLRRALDRNEFRLYYQPKLELNTGAIIGAEALLRWVRPNGEVILPAQFIPFAENSGLILSIGDWVLHEACAQAQAWADAGYPAKTVAVNISGMQLESRDFLEVVLTSLNATGLNPESLELEMTESVLMMNPESTVPILRSLKDHGVQISVDNYGTGYSSLHSLRKLPLDALKIDRSFVRKIASNPYEKTKVSVMISMGQSLNLRVCAEGVETAEYLKFLSDQGCDEAQGYYFGRPVPPEELVNCSSHLDVLAVQ